MTIEPGQALFQELSCKAGKLLSAGISLDSVNRGKVLSARSPSSPTRRSRTAPGASASTTPRRSPCASISASRSSATDPRRVSTWPTSAPNSPASSRRTRSGWPRRRRPTRNTTSSAPSSAGWGGVVWKTLGEDPPIVNVAGPRYGAIHSGDRRLIGLNNIELITDRALAGQPRGDQAGQARLAGPGARRLADGALRGAELDGDPQPRRGHRLRRRRAQFRLPARHERARHGLGRRPGAGIHRDGRALVQGGARACR